MRALWTPALGRVYGIRPWEVERLTVRELEGIQRDQLAQAQREREQYG